MGNQDTFNPSNFRYLTGEIGDAGGGDNFLGGYVQRYVAAAALKYGQVVQVDATGKVNVAITNLGKTIGVVVGGTNTNMDVITNSSLAGICICADANEDVLVQRMGTVYCVLDTDDVVIGDPIMPSAITAGSVGKGSAIPTVLAGAVAVTSSAANGPIVGGGSFATPVIGISLTTETVAGNPVLVILRGLI